MHVLINRRKLPGYAKCIFLTLRVLLGHFGLGKDALKKWMLNFRIGYLEKMVSDLQQSCHKLTISDRIILTRPQCSSGEAHPLLHLLLPTSCHLGPWP